MGYLALDTILNYCPDKDFKIYFLILRHFSSIYYKKIRKDGSPSKLESGIFRMWGTQCRSWLRHCATSRKVVGSIPNGVTEIFQ
jgi:hypothetical protein